MSSSITLNTKYFKWKEFKDELYTHQLLNSSANFNREENKTDDNTTGLISLAPGKLATNATGSGPNSDGLGTTPKNISILIRGEQSLSIDIAMKLSRMLGTSVSYWLNLQNAYDACF